jgi:heme/copper-type cytochrome/quinol oxidase subunit 2
MKKIFFLLLSILPVVVTAAEPEFVPHSGASAHPIVAAIKIVGMIATAVFVVVMVVRSVKVVKHDEDDSVHLPD